MNNKIIIVGALLTIFIAVCLAYATISLHNSTEIVNSTDSTNNTTQIVEVVEDENYNSQSQVDEGAFYSPQWGRTIHTGEIITMDGENYYRHEGYDQWTEVN